MRISTGHRPYTLALTHRRPHNGAQAKRAFKPMFATSSGTDVLPRTPDRLQQEEPMEEEEVKEVAEEAEEE